MEIGETEALFAKPRHPYTRMLLDAVPDLAIILSELCGEMF